MSIFDFFKKTKPVTEQKKHGLEKTRESFFNRLIKALSGRSSVDESFLDELEEVLLGSDVGTTTTDRILEKVKQRFRKEKNIQADELHLLLMDEIRHLLKENKKGQSVDFSLTGLPKPYVLMVVGVNGVGKTTTIGKLAHQFRKNGQKVLLVAADTFRAGAVDQLEIWSRRTDSGFFSKGMQADPSAVAFDAVSKAIEEQYDIVIIDTAGRLHNKVNLMNELGKIKRVVSKVIEQAPHDVLLVLDASTGQNAFEQARQFTAVTDVSALALTKLDGTAKGGVVIGISDQFRIPVRYVGTGEGMEDISLFDPDIFVQSMFEV